MLSSADLISIWEVGQQRHDTDKALIVLSCARPEMSWDELATLPLGQRDGLLMQLRRKMFGPQLDIGVRCVRCSEPLEFDASIDELVPPGWAPGVAEPICVEVDGVRLEARPICSRDLARLRLGQPDVEARRLLVETAVVRATRRGRAIRPADAPEPAVNALADALTNADPLADIEFQLDCPACEHRWILVFDIVPFLWRELANIAQNLLDEVYDLAVLVGWTEGQILELTPSRRAYYLGRARA